MRREQKDPELLGAALHCLSPFSCDQFQLYLVLHITSPGWEMHWGRKCLELQEDLQRDLDIQWDLERDRTQVNLMRPNKVQCFSFLSVLHQKGGGKDSKNCNVVRYHLLSHFPYCNAFSWFLYALICARPLNICDFFLILCCINFFCNGRKPLKGELNSIFFFSKRKVCLIFPANVWQGLKSFYDW